jgi:hypothetical protein
LAFYQLWHERDTAVRWHLSTSIAESKLLTRTERRVLVFLFAYYNKDKRRIDYPGHDRFAARHHIRPGLLQAALLALERGGYVMADPLPANVFAYIPNALLIQEALERAHCAYPDLFSAVNSL